MLQNRPPLPPFTLETAIQKVRLAEDAWNSHDPAAGRARLFDKQPLAQSSRISGGPRHYR